MQKTEMRRSGTALLLGAAGVGLVGLVIALATWAYLGSFTRYLADDYCEAVAVNSSSGIQAVIDRYRGGQWRATDRYSNLLFVALGESLGQNSMQAVPGLMIGLWVIGLAWTIREVRKTANLEWPGVFDWFLAALLAFLAILQAPNRFQTIYWRSSMATHFVPLVFMSYLAAFLVRRIRTTGASAHAWWAGVPAFLGAFMVGGFSEPPAAMMIVALMLALLGLWRWGRASNARPAALLLSWTLAGALLALLVMFFAPANYAQADSAPPGLLMVVERSARFTSDFIVDSLKVLPLPTAVSVLLPALLFFGLFVQREPRLGVAQQRRLWILAAVLPLLMYVLIAASFAPSAYGQSYPVERARFLGRLLMTATLMLEGALLGVLASQFGLWTASLRWAAPAAALALLLTAVYPLRAAWISWRTDVPEYREWTAAWDERNALIRARQAEGATDLVVAQLPGFYRVKELDTDPGHWVNRCAADYYGLASISAPPYGEAQP